MEQRADNQQVARKSLDRINVVLLTLGVLSFLTALVLRQGTALATTTPLYIVFTLVCSIYIAIRSKWRNWPYLLSITASVAVVWLVALVGFYRPNLAVLNDVTGMPDKSMSTAASYTFIVPESLTTTALFDCDTAPGPQCTIIQNIIGVGVDYAILTTGVIAGNFLVKPRSISLDKAQAKEFGLGVRT